MYNPMNRDFIQAVNDRLLFETPPQKTDAAIVLGNRMHAGDLARVTARHYFQGYFDNIILCGGVSLYSPYLLKLKAKNAFQRAVGQDVPPMTIPWKDIFVIGKKEVCHMRDVLLDLGVPKSAIVYIDDLSTNTGENFAFIADHVEQAGYKSATIVAAAYHQLRGMETCARWMPNLETHPLAVYPFSLTRKECLETWPKDPLFRAVVLSEYKKLDPENPNNYYNQGFCVPRRKTPSS
jgi:uncharacterized SAM-binding protein YcdF (DUF218 family)